MAAIAARISRRNLSRTPRGGLAEPRPYAMTRHHDTSLAGVVLGARWQMRRRALLKIVVGAAAAVSVGVQGWRGRARAQPRVVGPLIIAFDSSYGPTFLDPADTPGIGTPFVFLYALHDALIKPLPGNDMAACLAESWTESADGLAYAFKLREGLSL